MRLLNATVVMLHRHRSDAMTDPPEFPDGMMLTREERLPLPRYRELYRTVGDPHHWTSRILPDAELEREIHGENTAIFILWQRSRPAGWFELETRTGGAEIRIVHFAIMPWARGLGLSHLLLDHAVSIAFCAGARRLLLETNNLDHPAALPLYRRHGFEPYAKREVRTPAIGPSPEVASGAHSGGS